MLMFNLMKHIVLNVKHFIFQNNNYVLKKNARNSIIIYQFQMSMNVINVMIQIVLIAILKVVIYAKLVCIYVKENVILYVRMNLKVKFKTELNV